MVERMLQFCYGLELAEPVSNPGPRVNSTELPQAHKWAEMYALAEKYGITTLKDVARVKFQWNLNSPYWKKDCVRRLNVLPSLVSLVYEGTPDSDNGLRRILLMYFATCWDKWSNNPALKQVVTGNADFAFELIGARAFIAAVLSGSFASPFKQTCMDCSSTKKWKTSRIKCACGRYEDVNDLDV